MSYPITPQHAFVRPGPDALDQCVECGQPEAVHHRGRYDKIMRLSELDCRAALIQLADEVPAAVDSVLERLWQLARPAEDR
jgi:hypothetical protein